MFAKISGTILALISISGCATFQRQAAVHPVSVVEAKIDYCANLRKDYPDDIELSSAYKASCEFDSEVVKPRDLLVNLMSVGAEVCERELATLSANQRTVNAGLSSGSTALSSVATIVTGGLADDILSAGSTIAGSTRDHINSEVFRADNPSSIIRLVQAHRENLELTILKDWKTNGASKTRQDALRDANRYHHSCSLYNGLALINAAVAAKSDEVEKVNEDLQEKLESEE